jgi:hypothetical protein
MSGVLAEFAAAKAHRIDNVMLAAVFGANLV